MKRTIYIGTEQAQELAAMVLEYTIRSRATRPVDVKLLNREMNSSGLRVDNVINSNTPFSKQRVFVPALAGSGQAAYLDSDMVVFADINELFDASGNATIASCKTRQKDRDPQTSVVVFDVARCVWDAREVIASIDRDPSNYRPYLYEFSFAGGTQRCLPAEWNDLEEFNPESTRLLHFTDMDTQPWVTATNRDTDVWLACLKEAATAEPGVMCKLEEAIERFHARPSLAWQVRKGWRASADIPLLLRLRDVFLFVPPHALEHGIPAGLGRRLVRFTQSRAPRPLKQLVLFGCCLALLARRRRRILVWATLLNKKCVINFKRETVL